MHTPAATADIAAAIDDKAASDEEEEDEEDEDEDNFGEGDDDSMSRPFGVALLLAGWDEAAGPGLFHAEPSGTFTRYDAKAIGSGSEGAQSTLQEQYRADMTLLEAQTLALSTLKAVMEEKVSATNVDIATVAPTYALFTQQQVQAVIDRL